MIGTKEQIAAAKIILNNRNFRQRGGKVTWKRVWDHIIDKVGTFDYMDFCRLTKVTTKNLKSMIKE